MSKSQLGRSLVSILLTLCIVALLATALSALPSQAATPSTTTATFTVTNTNNSGVGSLRRAINDANANPGADIINFDLTGCTPATGGPCVISLTSALPTITDAVTINGVGKTFLLIDANNNSRVFDIEAVPVTIQDLTIQNGNTPDGGGGIYARGALTLQRVRLANNVAALFGGGALVAGTLSVSNTDFINNRAIHGGGAYVSSTLSAVNTVFSDNLASGSGGGAYGVGGATVNTSDFAQNTATSTVGGGLFVGGALTLMDTQFISNTAGNSGGGVSAIGVVTLSGGRFERNRSLSSYGGGLFASSKVMLTNTEFINNGAGVSGGGLATVDMAMLNGGRFEENRAQDRGGGVFADKLLTISATQFIRNSASMGGGAAGDAEAMLTNARFEQNRADSDGGGIRVDGTLTATNSEFIGNRTGDDGGGADSFGSIILVGGRFEANISDQNGGGVHTSQSLTITNTQFISNTAGDDGGGGAYVSGAVVLNGARFERNYSFSYGGGIRTYDPLIIINTTFISNAARFDGGGLFARDRTTIISSTLSGNHANDNGGGIYNDSFMTLTNSLVQNNSADDSGGGIYNGSATALLLSNSTIQNNSAGTTGGGLSSITGSLIILDHSSVQTNTAGSNGGGIYAHDNSLILNDSNVQDNASTQAGGGIYNNNLMVMSNSTLRGNRTSSPSNSQGGGLYNSGVATITQSAVFSNTTTSDGGGIANFGLLTLRNSTLSGNRANDNGGGFHNGTNAGQATLNYVSIINNAADSDNNGNGNGGGIRRSNGVVTITNVLITGNQDRGGQAHDCSGTLSSLGYNLIQSTMGCTINGTPTGNLSSANPLVGALQDNGGATWTHALLASSPAINAANPASCLATDQRGIARPLRERCDIGAFETLHGAANSIVFNPLASRVVTDTPFTIVATATSGLPVSFAALTPGVCTLNGHNVSLVTTGVCTIRATQAGNGFYAPAPNVDQGFQVFPTTTRSNQTITFNPLPDKPLSDPPFNVNATASSGLTVSFASQTPSVCMVAGNMVTLLAAGTCTMQASQAGDAAFNPAPNVERSFQVTNKSHQTIIFNPLPSKLVSDPPFTVIATTTSGLPVSFTSLATGVCTIAGNNVTLIATGACTVRASQGGDNAYHPATDVDQSFQVFPAATRNDQTITFNALADKFVTDPPFNVNATASSGLPVSFASQTPTICTVNGNTITLIEVGACTLQASQAGNASFNPAPPILRSFQVNDVPPRSDQTITFDALANKTFGDPPFTIHATASSGLLVSFASRTASVCTVSGNTVTLVAIGACTLRASQTGNASFNPAPDVDQSFQINAGATGHKVYLPLIVR